ncbi:hypothetical protein QTQ03_28100 [Micromonospora sp. WMMA1363]|uniref:hypothetical protein n=1 Tax=Micromonospora sp. WMMA1363 TaxID=3053985 RepID=UPI00259C9747|nr:hypothetical protein [Micromonospora sp. WMMA1363]MDM4723271.1 hypothetical protein [Micromonospora sp. WMMA1363]
MFLHAEDCSWIQYRPGRDTATVTYGGPRPLWTVTTLAPLAPLAPPSIDRYGITAPTTAVTTSGSTTTTPARPSSPPGHRTSRRQRT